MPGPGAFQYAFAEEHDYVSPGTANSRLNGKETTSTNQSIEIATGVADTTRKCLKLSETSADGGRAVWFQNFQRVEHDIVDTDFIDRWTEFYYECEVYTACDVSSGGEYGLLRFGPENDTTANSAVDIRLRNGGGANSNIRVYLQNTIVATPALGFTWPDEHWKIRVYYKTGNGSGGNATIKVWVNNDHANDFPSGSWSQILNDSSTSTSTKEVIGVNFYFRELAGSGTAPNFIEYYNCGWCGVEGYSVSGSESFSDRRDAFPLIASYTDDQVFDLIHYDAWHGCMTLDVSQTSLVARVQHLPGQGTVGWSQRWASVRYGTSSGSLTSETSRKRYDTGEPQNEGYVEGFEIDFSAIGANPGDTVYWSPSLYDAESSETNSINSDVEFSAKLLASTASPGTRTIGVLSCGKSDNGKGNHDIFQVFADLPTPPDLVVWQDDIGYFDEDEAQGGWAGGQAQRYGTSSEMSDRARMFRSFTDDPFKRDLIRTTPIFFMHGDHVVFNNWESAWWDSDHTSYVGTETLIGPVSSSSESSAEVITRAEAVDQAFNWLHYGLGLKYALNRGSTSSITRTHATVYPYYRSFLHGRLHCLLYDTRTWIEQDSTNHPNNPWIGDDQQSWHEAQLAAVTRPCVLALSPSPIGDIQVNTDNWEGAAGTGNGRPEFIDGFNDNLTNIDVICGYGDRHIPWMSTGHLRTDTLSSSDPNLAACRFEMNAAPVASAFYTGRTTGDWTTYDVQWGLRDHVIVPGQPALNDYIAYGGVITVDESAGTVIGRIYEGQSGSLADSGVTDGDDSDGVAKVTGTLPNMASWSPSSGTPGLAKGIAGYYPWNFREK